MARTRTVQMDDDELTQFLGQGGTGVIAFDTPGDEPPYSLPVSYGFEATSGAFYFRLAADGGKDRLLDRPVSFVTHDRTDDGYRSVVATGHLDPASEDTVDTALLESLDRVRIPLVDVFDQPLDEVEFQFFRLHPDELTGRTEARSDR